jgi:hypothetical protein
MKWPWVSRLAYEAVCSERDRLVAENGELREHLKRTDRHAQGMSEVPRAPKPELGQMPNELRAHIMKFQTGAIAAQMMRESWRRRYRGDPWDVIKREMMQVQSIEEAIRE